MAIWDASRWCFYIQSCSEQLCIVFGLGHILFFLGKYLEVEWLCSRKGICFTSPEAVKRFSEEIVPFYIP